MENKALVDFFSSIRSFRMSDSVVNLCHIKYSYCGSNTENVFFFCLLQVTIIKYSTSNKSSFLELLSRAQVGSVHGNVCRSDTELETNKAHKSNLANSILSDGMGAFQIEEN